MKKRIAVIMCALVLTFGMTTNVMAESSPTGKPDYTPGVPDDDNPSDGGTQPGGNNPSGGGTQPGGNNPSGGGTSTGGWISTGGTQSGSKAPQTGESDLYIYGVAAALFLSGTVVISRRRLEALSVKEK